MPKRLAVAALVVIVGCQSVAPNALEVRPAIRSTNEVAAAAKRDLSWLADDAREGRGLGTQGLEDAGAFIADRFSKLGLKPLPGMVDYFQRFDYDAGKTIGPETALMVNGIAIDRKDYTPLTASAEGNLAGDVVFVGYAISSTERDYDDFGDLDVKDKIVLAMRWEPHDADGNSRWDKKGSWSAEASLQKKLDRAAEHGAKAILFVNAPTHHDDAERVLPPRGRLRGQAPIAVFHVATDVANQILAKAGTPSLAMLQKQIDETAKPASMPLPGVHIDGNVQLLRETRGVRNVVAMLPGVGPRASEYVVVGAHYDHVGRSAFGGSAANAVGQIHNGADDNASGTTTVLQLAQEFALAGRQQRTIVFCAFTLEELGLIGSKEFVEHLPIPKDQIVAMVNLDMVGRLRNEYLYVGGGGTADAFESILGAADKASPIELKNMGKGGPGPSDHASFSRVKIPVLFLFTGMHSDYHRPTDDIAKINFTGIAQVVDLSFDLVQRLCRMDKPAYVSKFDMIEPNTNIRSGELPTTAPSRHGGATTQNVSRAQLGVVPSYTTDETIKGVLIDDVTPDTAAAEANLRGGDRIVKINEKRIDTLYDLTEFLESAKPGDTVKIDYLRDGKPMSAEATLKARGESR